MAQVKHGDTIKVHYTGKLNNGEVFDSSRNREPLEFTVGERALIAGFEEGTIGMNIGDIKTITLPCDQAYGQKREELIVEIPLAELPEKIKPVKGLRMTLHQANGQTIPVTITGVSATAVTLDANHPLAGQELTFEIEIMEIIQ